MSHSHTILVYSFVVGSARYDELQQLTVTYVSRILGLWSPHMDPIGWIL